MVRCPGQDLRFWKLDDIFDVECPHCGVAIEFWRDEPNVKCPACRKMVVNPKLDLGCAQWCQHAEQCLGALMDPADLLAKRLIKEMKNVLGDARHEIDHALAVFRYTRQILASEQADARVVNAAAILHCVDFPCAGSAGEMPEEFRECADPQAAREALSRCGVDASLADSICEVIAECRSGTEGDDAESRILRDAEWLARLEACPSDDGGSEAKERIRERLRTEKGRELATTLLADART
jgi:hypothetical protein